VIVVVAVLHATQPAATAAAAMARKTEARRAFDMGRLLALRRGNRRTGSSCNLHCSRVIRKEVRMNSGWRWLLSAALAASAMSSVATVQAKGPVDIDQIPAPAREAILSHVGAGRLVGVDEETWQGEPAYEAHIQKQLSNVTIWVDAAGNVLATGGGI
jgi:hypothetical protein